MFSLDERQTEILISSPSGRNFILEILYQANLSLQEENNYECNSATHAEPKF